VIALLAILLALLRPGGTAGAASAAPDTTTTQNVTTAAYGNLRDDWDSGEPALTQSAVKSGSFGLLFSTKLIGAIYGQPLVYNGTVLVTTENARAYALNAQTGQIIWQRSLGYPFLASTIGCSDLEPAIGSTATGVVDPTTGTYYFTTRTVRGAQSVSNGHWYLQAVDATTGAERAGFPVEIKGTPSNTRGVPFDEGYAMQRPALLLLNGVVYMAFASNCDITPYRGIVVGVSTTTTAKVTTMWSAESGAGTDVNSQAGIWQSGAGLVSDGPNQIILTTGNGVSPSPAPSDKPPATLSESVIRLQVGTNGNLTPTQFFAPSDAPDLDANDNDLGAGGPIELPPSYFGTKSIPHLLVQVSKDGRIFLLNANNMGGYQQGPGGGDANLQTLGPFTGVWGHPAAYGGHGGWVYVLESGGGGFLRALSYGLNGSGVPELANQATSAQSFGYTSGSPLVTSNGITPGSAIVWVEYAQGPNPAAGQLQAYNAIPNKGTMQLLWSGTIGQPVHFGTPTAANGVVYVGNNQGELMAFAPGAGAGAALDTPNVRFGRVPVGRSRVVTFTISARRTVRLDHFAVSGLQELSRPVQTRRAKPGKTAGPALYPASGTIRLRPGVVRVERLRRDTALGVGRALRVRVRYTPRSAGPIVGTIRIRTSAGPSTINFSGYGTRKGLFVSAEPLTFGAISDVTGGRSLALTFSNSWSHAERITGYGLPGEPFHVTGLPPVGATLGPQQSVTVSVLFQPTDAGFWSTQLTIRTNEGQVTLPVRGDGIVGLPQLAVSPTSIDFGPVPVGHTSTRTFHVRDAGSVPLLITRAIEPLPPFAAPVPLPEGISIDPGLSTEITVSFTPRRRGAVDGEYLVRGDDGRGPILVRLTGTGI
jgi:outer membrane protein assembly factor BamB